MLYQRLAIAAIAPEGIVQDLRQVRARCPRSGSPPPDASVVVLGPFATTANPDDIVATVREAVDALAPFSLRTVEPEIVGGSLTAVVLPLEEERLFRELRERLASALGTAAERLAPAETYRPVVTVVQDVSREDAERALSTTVAWRVNYFWTVREMDILREENGPIWRSLARVDFGRPRSASL